MVEAPQERREKGASVGSALTVAYIMSRFPKITETFVLNEIVELERLGFDVQVFPLLREKEQVTHPEAERLTRLAHFTPFLNVAIFSANVRMFVKSPLKLMRVWTETLRCTMGSLNFFVGALGVLLKCTYLAQRVRELGVEHIHAHFGSHPALAAMAVSRLSGIPFSFTAHGSDIHIDQTGLDRKIRASRFAVMISEYNRKFVIENFDESLSSKMRIVHCGVDPNQFHPLGSDTSEGRLEILCVASFRDVKGHKYLVEACALLRDRGIDFHCHLIGSGPLESEIRQQVDRLHLEEKFIFHGPRPQAYVHEQMLRASVVTLTSIFGKRGNREGIPVSLMEAMASARPVVASRISGIPELVEDGVDGLLVEPRNAEELADAFQSLVESPEMASAMGLAARKKVMREFNLRRSVSELARLFKMDPR